MRTTALLGILGLALVGCLGSDFADSVEGSWQLISGTVDGEEIPIIDSHPITIGLDAGEVTGTASCNGYGGSYTQDGTTITFGNLAMTEMACFPEETMDAERLYADGLIRVDTVSLDEDLTLRGADVEMVFAHLETPSNADLLNTVWVLDTMIDGDTATSPSGRATLEFFSDGSMLGDTGCRPFSSHYEVDETMVMGVEIVSDGHQCEPDLADQDAHIISVLSEGFRFEIDGDRLSLTSGDQGLGYQGER